MCRGFYAIKINMYSRFFKRAIDFVLVFCVLAIIWTILLFIIVWVTFQMRIKGSEKIEREFDRNGVGRAYF